MKQIFGSGRPDRQRGAVAIEVAIITIAGLAVAVLGSVTLLGSSFLVTSSGSGIINGGITSSASQLIVRTGVVASSGEVDVDGNNTILLSGDDELAVVKLKFIVEVTAVETVDLTPPNTVDDTQTDPDSSGLNPRTFIVISWDEFTTNSAQWTVAFMGDSNGDYILEKGERAEITVWLHKYDGANALYDLGAGSSDGYVDTATELLQKLDSFTLEILVGGSTSLVLERTLPYELGTSDLLD